MSETQQIQNVKLTSFALRHFDKEFGGTKILNLEPKEFEEILNREVDEFNNSIDPEPCSDVVDVLPGYAGFCKLVAIENFTDAKVGVVPITIANHQYIRSGFSARREGEFETFSRWIELPVSAPKANYLMVVLYDKEQIDKEAMADYNRKKSEGGIEAVGLEEPSPFEGDWGVVAILGQNGPEEEPMKPATFDRNYMPIEFGGSGMKYPKVPAKPKKNVDENGWPESISKPTPEEIEYKKELADYKEQMDEIRKTRKKSVDFWKNHVTVK